MLSSCLLTLRSTDDCSGSYMIRLPEVGSIGVRPGKTLSRLAFLHALSKSRSFASSEPYESWYS